MTTSPIRRIALVGLGALGIMYGDFFAEKLGTENVVFLADETRCRRYGAARVTCNGRTDHFRFMTPEMYRTACGEADLLFFCVKGTALTTAINEVRPVIGPDTVIVSVLNGITSEDVIEDAQTAGTVVHSVAQAMDALRQGTAVTYSRIGELRIGITEASTRKTAALVRLEDFFNRTDFAYQTETDILRRMWCKWMLNVGVNQTVAACAGTFKDVQHTGQERERMKAAMREVIAEAEKSGINLTEDDLNEYVAIIDTLSPDGMPSMRQDTLARRPTEVELFAGTVMRKARTLGIAVPVNEALYREITALPVD